MLHGCLLSTFVSALPLESSGPPPVPIEDLSPITLSVELRLQGHGPGSARAEAWALLLSLCLRPELWLTAPRREEEP